MKTKAQEETKPKYGQGYDVGSGLYIVGKRTERGTIAKAEYDFVTYEEAKAKADELNAKHNDQHQYT